MTGASRSRAPRSASIITAVAVTILVIENHRNVVRSVTGRRVRISARPLVMNSAAPSAVTIAAARPGGARRDAASSTTARRPSAGEVLGCRAVPIASAVRPAPPRAEPAFPPRSRTGPRAGAASGVLITEMSGFRPLSSSSLPWTLAWPNAAPSFW